MIEAHGSKAAIPGMNTPGMSEAFDAAQAGKSYHDVQEAFATAAATAAPGTPA